MTRMLIQIEKAAGDCDEIVSIGLDPGAVVAETGPVYPHRVWVARGVDLHSGGETLQITVGGVSLRTFAHECGLGRAIGVYRHPRILGIDATAVPVLVVCGVAERTSVERHAFHVPKPHMFGKTCVVGCEEVAVINHQGAALEGADIIADRPRRC